MVRYDPGDIFADLTIDGLLDAIERPEDRR